MTTPSDFAALVAHHQGAVCAVAYAVLRDRARSEEVAQDAFLIAWQKLPGMVPPPQLPGWVCGIARNLARNAARRRKESAMTDEPIASAPSALDTLLAHESTLIANQALAALAETDREAIVLYYRGEQSMADVALALGITEAAAKKRVLRGRDRLQAAAREVEGSLRASRPGPAFTAGCVAALAAGLGAKTAAAAGSRPLGVKLAIGAAIAVPVIVLGTWLAVRGASSHETATAPATTSPYAHHLDPDARQTLGERIATARAERLAAAHVASAMPVTRPTSSAPGAPALPLPPKPRVYDFAGSSLFDVLPAPPPRPPGPLGKRELREAIRSVQPLVRDCYDQEGRGERGTLQLTVRLEGEPDAGTIATDAHVDGDFAGNADLAECVRQALLSIELPGLDTGGVIDVIYPFAI